MLTNTRRKPVDGIPMSSLKANVYCIFISFHSTKQGSQITLDQSIQPGMVVSWAAADQRETLCVWWEEQSVVKSHLMPTRMGPKRKMKIVCLYFQEKYKEMPIVWGWGPRKKEKQALFVMYILNISTKHHGLQKGNFFLPILKIQKY